MSGHGRIIIATACIIAAIAAPTRALGQHAILVVNGDVITDFDIEQRMKFNTLLSHKPAVRQEVIEELIDDRLKVQIGRHYKIEVPDSDIESSYADIAKRMQKTPDQLTQVLAQSGVDGKTLKARIRADMTWQYVNRSKLPSNLQISERFHIAPERCRLRIEAGKLSLAHLSPGDVDAASSCRLRTYRVSVSSNPAYIAAAELAQKRSNRIPVSRQRHIGEEETA
jgi:hypothetical protein